jgi:hypothetical protein
MIFAMVLVGLAFPYTRNVEGEKGGWLRERRWSFRGIWFAGCITGFVCYCAKAGSANDPSLSFASEPRLWLLAIFPFVIFWFLQGVLSAFLPIYQAHLFQLCRPGEKPRWLFAISRWYGGDIDFLWLDDKRLLMAVEDEISYNVYILGEDANRTPLPDEFVWIGFLSLKPRLLATTRNIPSAKTVLAYVSGVKTEEIEPNPLVHVLEGNANGSTQYDSFVAKVKDYFEREVTGWQRRRRKLGLPD